MKPTVGAALTAALRRASGLSGAPPPRPPPAPPRPPRPPRPAAAGGVWGAEAAGGAAGAGGVAGAAGANSAVTIGARSASVDHRSTWTCKVALVDSPITAARRSSTPFSPRTAAVAPITRAMPITAARRALLLPVTVVRSLDASEPLHETLQFVIFQPGAALAHVHRDDPPALRAETCAVDAIDTVATRARPFQQSFTLGIGEERRHLLCHVGTREWLAARPETFRQPVEQDAPLRHSDGHGQPAMLCGDERVPSLTIERVIGVVVDAVARHAMREEHLPHGA